VEFWKETESRNKFSPVVNPRGFIKKAKTVSKSEHPAATVKMVR
jgi:hypothetical protein